MMNTLSLSLDIGIDYTVIKQLSGHWNGTLPLHPTPKVIHPSSINGID